MVKVFCSKMMKFVKAQFFALSVILAIGAALILLSTVILVVDDRYGDYSTSLASLGVKMMTWGYPVYFFLWLLRTIWKFEHKKGI